MKNPTDGMRFRIKRAIQLHADGSESESTLVKLERTRGITYTRCGRCLFTSEDVNKNTPDVP